MIYVVIFLCLRCTRLKLFMDLFFYFLLFPRSHVLLLNNLFVNLHIYIFTSVKVSVQLCSFLLLFSPLPFPALFDIRMADCGECVGGIHSDIWRKKEKKTRANLF